MLPSSAQLLLAIAIIVASAILLSILSLNPQWLIPVNIYGIAAAFVISAIVSSGIMLYGLLYYTGNIKVLTITVSALVLFLSVSVLVIFFFVPVDRYP